MKLSTLLLIAGVIGLAFGVAFVLAPGQLLALYGMTLEGAPLFLGRLFGAALIEVGLLGILARNVGDPAARQAIVLSVFVGLAVGFVVALIGQLAGAFNALGWSTVAIYLLLALGFAYFQFMKPATA